VRKDLGTSKKKIWVGPGFPVTVVIGDYLSNIIQKFQIKFELQNQL
jgi:hypothetical protein